MPKFSRKLIYNIDSEQIENAFINTMFDMAENLCASVKLQIVEDIIYSVLNKNNYQVSKKTPNDISSLKESLLDKFDERLTKSINLGLLKCLVPTIDWDNYIDETEKTKGEM